MAASASNSKAGFPPSPAKMKPAQALEKAFDYRGDVTLTLKDGRVIHGYIFDRRPGATLSDSAVRVMPSDDRTKLDHPVLRHRRAGLHRPRQRRGPHLRSLGKEVLGKESRRRKEHRHPAREAGLAIATTFRWSPLPGAIKQERTSTESSHRRLNRWPPGGAAAGGRRRMACHHQARRGGGRVDTHR